MVSFLIPVFNYDIKDLVAEIIESATCAEQEYELLAYDDASNIKCFQKNNLELNNIKNVTYKILEQNIGRSAIRNLLAEQSKGDWLCFLDCDSRITNKDFVKNYIKETNSCDVICGGINYCDFEQIQKEYILHWKNGSIRENIESSKHKPAFMTCNFFIKKSVFETVKFNEELKKYGHEDTLFGISLKQYNFKVKYINNPVIHLGLKSTESFLEDIKTANGNLKFLYNQPKYQNLFTDLSIIKAYRKLNNIHLSKVFSFFASILEPIIIKLLKTKNPSLFLLDIYKLNSFIKAK